MIFQIKMFVTIKNSLDSEENQLKPTKLTRNPPKANFQHNIKIKNHPIGRKTAEPGNTAGRCASLFGFSVTHTCSDCIGHVTLPEAIHFRFHFMNSTRHFSLQNLSNKKSYYIYYII